MLLFGVDEDEIMEREVYDEEEIGGRDVRWIVFFIVCGDLLVFDLDVLYKLLEDYVLLDLV